MTEPSRRAIYEPPTSSNAAIRTEQSRLGILLTMIGFLIFIVGAKPDWFALDRSITIGFVQVTIFTVGLGLMCIGGYVGLASLWGNEEKTIMADIGLRLIGTGYVITAFSGMADVFGMGTQSFPEVPFFGPWQAVGVQIGQFITGIGLIMMVPYHRFNKQ